MTSDFDLKAYPSFKAERDLQFSFGNGIIENLKRYIKNLYYL